MAGPITSFRGGLHYREGLSRGNSFVLAQLGLYSSPPGPPMCQMGGSSVRRGQRNPAPPINLPAPRCRRRSSRCPHATPWPHELPLSLSRFVQHPRNPERPHPNRLLYPRFLRTRIFSLGGGLSRILNSKTKNYKTKIKNSRP